MRGIPLPALLLAACSGGHAPPPLSTPAEPARQGEIVAMFDGAPVTKAEVLETSVEIDWPGMLRRHFIKRLIEREKKALGIENTAEELDRFARMKLDELKARRPEDYRRALEASGKSEAEYARAYAQSPALYARLVTEKIVAHGLLKSGGAKVTMFAAEGDGRALRSDLWVAPGMLEKEFGREAESGVFSARVGASWAGSGFRVRLDGLYKPAPELSAWAVLEGIGGVNDATVEAHLEWLLSRTPIRVLKK